MQLLLGSTNPGKLFFYKKYLMRPELKLLTLKDLGFLDEPLEIGQTYLENALQKARFYAEATEYPTLAEDGGLEVKALDGRPGLESKRWVAPGGSNEDRINKILKLLVGKADRTAQFKLVTVVYFPSERDYVSVEEKIDGVIATKPSRREITGFPYESLFWLPQAGKHYSELTMKEHEQINHRIRACRKLLLKLEPYLAG